MTDKGLPSKSAPLFDWQAATAAVEASLCKLSRLHGKVPESGTIPYEMVIPGIGRQLAQMRPTHGVATHQTTSTPAATARQLKAVAKHARALLRAVEDLNSPAIDALNFRHPWPGGAGGFETHLRLLCVSADHGLVPELPPGAGLGRPIKRQALKIAITCGVHYQGLTGTKPTVIVSELGKAGGPFVSLLDEVYTALVVDASAESMARQAIKAMEKMERKTPR